MGNGRIQRIPIRYFWTAVKFENSIRCFGSTDSQFEEKYFDAVTTFLGPIL